MVYVAGCIGLLGGSFCQSQSWLARGHGRAHSKNQFLAVASSPSGLSARSATIKPALQSGPTKSFLLVMPVT